MSNHHARRRCKQRANTKLTRNENARIIADIEGGRAEFLYMSAHGSGNRDIYLVKFGKKNLRRVVFDRHDKVIVTILSSGKTI